MYLGLCGVCSCISCCVKLIKCSGDSHQQADVVASGRKANQWIQGVQSDRGVFEGLIYN
jgi:hypothetical protein